MNIDISNVAYWNAAFEAVKSQFEVPDLHPEQRKAIRSFFQGNNVFVNLPTGFGKSLIFQCLLIVPDIVLKKPRGSIIIVVISPMPSLMEDQVRYLTNLGIPAIAITNDEDADSIQKVLNGDYMYCLVRRSVCCQQTVWRGIFKCQSFTEKLIGVAIDEAHCITQW